MRVITLDGTGTIVVAILAYVLGRFLTAKTALLETYRIPEAVTGGLLVALVRAVGGIELDFTTGQFALLAFFASIGLNASVRDLAAAGRPLALLLGIAAIALLIENFVGVSCAWVLGMEPLLGLMAAAMARQRRGVRRSRSTHSWRRCSDSRRPRSGWSLAASLAVRSAVT
jgi:ESS family glutamate:Na+ symporter